MAHEQTIKDSMRIHKISNYELASLILFHFVWVRFNSDNSEEYSGIDEATLEDLAFPSLFEGGTAPLSPFQRSLANSRLAASPSRTP
jgi:hypothetical protein